MRQIRITITHIRTCAAVFTARTAALTCFSSSCTSLGRRTGAAVGVLVVVVDIDVVVACDVVVDFVGCVDVGVGACDDVVDIDIVDVVVVVDVDVVVDVGVGDVVVDDAACDCDVANVVVDVFFAALIGTT